MTLDADDPVSHAQLASEKLPCPGCGVPTLIRFGGRPGHFLCLLKLPDPEISLGFLTKLKRDYPPRKSRIWWCPPMPEVTDLVEVSGWNWQREYNSLQELLVLDRSGAHIAAAASVDVAAGVLDQTGPGRFTGDPGFYKTTIYAWHDRSTPHPLGQHAADHVGNEIWIPHTRMQLLVQLESEDRWVDASFSDSRTCPDAVRLTKWTNHVNEMRSRAITTYGRDSNEYDQVKTNFSQARALMLGKRRMGGVREFGKTDVRRPDWAMAIEDLSAVTLWRWYDELTQVAVREGVPGLAPVAMRHIDEIVIPERALDLFTTTWRTPTKGPLQIDPTGMRLGTFKVKGIE